MQRTPAAAEAPPAALHHPAPRGGGGGGPVYVVVVRHGERLDEANRVEWRKTRTEETRADPPLTELGWKQAGAAGAAIRQKLADIFGPQAVPTVYSSPAVRCLSTAAGMAPVLQFKEVVPAYALNCCAAAKDWGVGSFPRKRPSAQTVRGATLACWPPHGDPEKVDEGQKGMRRRGGGFEKFVAELASRHDGGDVVVMVTHREGIWELQQHCKEKIARQKYCSTHYYRVEGDKVVTWDVESHRRTPTPPRSSDKSDFEANLEQGKGTLIVDAPHVFLVSTPGAPATAFGDPLTAGEKVELCSVAVEAEADAGHFVLVERSNGDRGWLPIADFRRE
eukprot:Hpha_TRINITY_DN16728_c1_g10::TRINITY_DN16728_c1_g10_i1::g.78366::m.78366